MRETWRKGCSRGALWDNELRVQRKDGEYRWFLIRYSLRRPESRSKTVRDGLAPDQNADWVKADHRRSNSGSPSAVIPSPSVLILRMTHHFAIFDLQEETLPARNAGARISKETYMVLDKNDESILTNIDRLVKEEEHL